MLKRTWIILVVLSIVGLLALPVVAYAHDDAQNCPEGAEDNRHPSGKDRSCESGSSEDGTTGSSAQSEGGETTVQGTSESDPDDDGRGPDRTNGGSDKPNGGPGGLDHADQDTNNGCGNDDDFEDDNEGWCGGKPKPNNVGGVLGAQGGPDVEVAGGKSVEAAGRTRVQGKAKESSDVASAGGPDSAAEVLGESLLRTPAPTAVLGVEFVRSQVMAVTGSPVGVMVLMALALLGFGALLLRASKVTV